MIHFYNLIDCKIENINLAEDILANERIKYFESKAPVSDKVTLNTESMSYNYDVSIAKSKLMKFSVTSNNVVYASSKAIDDKTYAVCFYSNGMLFKKLVFTYNHMLVSLEYYSTNGAPYISFEPRRSKIGLCLVSKMVGYDKQFVLYPFEFEDRFIDEVVNNLNTFVVKANTDEGIVLFLTNEQREQAQKIIDEIVEKEEEDKKPISYISEEDKSLANILDPKSFNTKRNLASSVNILYAEEFVPSYENEDSVVEIKNEVELSPDKIIDVDDTYKYYGSLDSDGYRQGYGRTALNNGYTAYEGYYDNDMRNGQGSYYYKDGSLCYHGEWKNNKRNGIGVGVSSKDSSIHVGNWFDNAPVGNGVRINPDGSIKFVNKALEDGSYIQITFKDNGEIVLTKYSKDGQLLSSKGFNNL